MADERPGTKAEQREETMRRLIGVARAHFAEHGYAQAAAEAIVQQAGVTRGALYHHFGSKAGLFGAAVAAIQREVAEQVAAASAAAGPDPWAQLLAGCRAFMRASLAPEARRILLIDGPAVIGWDAWRELDAANAMRLLEEGLRELAGAGVIDPGALPAATHLLSGAMNEAVLWIARAPDPDRALAAAAATLERLLSGLRRR